jgi:hypothetical protein
MLLLLHCTATVGWTSRAGDGQSHPPRRITRLSPFREREGGGGPPDLGGCSACGGCLEPINKRRVGNLQRVSITLMLKAVPSSIPTISVSNLYTYVLKP